MFKGYRDGKFALGLIIGGGTVLILFLFGQSIYDRAKCYETTQCDRSAAKYEGNDFPDWWWWDWTGNLVTSDDTFAQWIMAFFTIAVTLLVWRTLIATQKIARDTRVIGEAQVRAHLLVEKGTDSISGGVVEFGKHWELSLTLKNFGNTPAKNIRYALVVECLIGDDPRLIDWKLEDWQFESIGDVVNPSGTVDLKAMTERQMIEGDIHTIRHPGTSIFVLNGEVRYSDVFGNDQSERFWFNVSGTYSDGYLPLEGENAYAIEHPEVIKWEARDINSD